MGEPRDPFAPIELPVSDRWDHDAEQDFGLLVPTGRELVFGELWVSALGGTDRAISALMDAYGPTSGPRKASAATTQDDKLGKTVRDLLFWGGQHERELGIKAVISVSDGLVSPRLLDVFARALGVEAAWRQRLAVEGLIHEMRSRPPTQSRTSFLDGLKDADLGSRDTLHRRARMIEAMGLMSYQLPSLEWINSGQARAKADAIVDQLSEAVGEGQRPLPFDLRWAAFVLIEGYCLRRRQVDLPLHSVINFALGLMTDEGDPRMDVALGGVQDRTRFLLLARERALNPASSIADAMAEVTDADTSYATMRKWLGRPLFKRASELWRAKIHG